MPLNAKLLAAKTENSNARRLAQPQSSENGFTLIEILIAIFVVVVGMVGASKLQTASVKAQVNEHQSSQALTVLEDLAGRMRLDNNKAGYITNALDIPALCSGAAPAKACSAYANIAADNSCSAAESASFNIWNSFCRADKKLRAQFQTLTIACAPAANGACAIDAIYTLQAVVKARSVSVQSRELNNQTISLQVYP